MGPEARRAGRRSAGRSSRSRPTSPARSFTEHCRECAKIADKFTILRSHSHNDNGHITGYHYVMTGHQPAFADGEHPIPNNEPFPSLGSIVARELGRSGNVPPYINLPHPMAAGGPGFYGAEYAPFVIEADPIQPDFEVKDLGQLEGLDRSALRPAAASCWPGSSRTRQRDRPGRGDVRPTTTRPTT